MQSKNRQYASIVAYHRYLKKFKYVGNILPGRFYAYVYDFSKDYPYEELKFYDFEPISFIFEILPESNSFLGLNFHHMAPPQVRLLWLNRVIKFARLIDDPIQTKFTGGTGRPVFKIGGLNYPRVYQVLRKSKIAIRRYRMDRVSMLRAIPVNEIDEVMRYYSRTYYGTGIKQIIARYQNYKP